MLNYLKKKIQDVKIEQRIRLQEAELRYYKDRYARWLELHEGKHAESVLKNAAGTDGKLSMISFGELSGKYPLKKWDSEFLLFVDMKAGNPDMRAETIIMRYLEEHPDVDLVYTDEDYMGSPSGETASKSPSKSSRGERRIAPWMKPCFSPDTLMAFPYIGHLFALRREAYEEIMWLEDGDCDVRIYDFLLKCAERDGRIEHIPEILYHNRITEEEFAAYEELERDAFDRDHPKSMTVDENMPWHQRMHWNREAYDQIRIEAAKRRGYPAKIEADRFGIRQLLYEIRPEADGEMPLVSIIIPSKDNVDVLERCLYSIRKHAGYDRYEIIVVDNGSAGAARARLMNLAEHIRFRYFYQPMEFNFSAMVNFGVSKAAGSYVLLLNDDCEVLQDDWLIRMLGQAQLPHVGAVGAKLLYPDSDLIQHTGVTNLSVGPAHKLQEKSDSVSYYYGRNRMNYDYIGVTAACLLVSKKIYEQVGGFDEDIRVAFNDVDFCFTLIESGFYNVMRCDVILYHYESLSRGNDLVSEEKMARMLSERDKLYEKHPDFWGRDDFYSPNLIGNSIDYVADFHFDYEKEDHYTSISRVSPEIQPQWYNDSVFVTIENCRKAEALELKNVEPAYHISGWSYVLNQDNSRYETSLLLQEEESGIWYRAEAFRYWRPDVVQILPEQKHVDLSGFIVRIRESELPKGQYHIYAFVKDLCSRQKLLKDTGAVLKAD